MYWNQNMSTTDIWRKSGYPHSLGNFSKLMYYFTKLRTRSEAQLVKCERQDFQTTVFNKSFKTSVHQTWDGNMALCRSSYESDLCEELDAGQIPYVVEGLRIRYFDTVKNRQRVAIPDFYLPEQNLIIEVKSAFTYDRQNMLDRAKAYYEHGYGVILEYEHESYTMDRVEAELFDMDCRIQKCEIAADGDHVDGEDLV